VRSIAAAETAAGAVRSIAAAGGAGAAADSVRSMAAAIGAGADAVRSTVVDGKEAVGCVRSMVGRVAGGAGPVAALLFERVRR
jgi:hypothetical protein